MLLVKLAVFLSAVLSVNALEAESKAGNPNNWPNWGHDLSNSRHVANSAINENNIHKLRLKWNRYLPGDVVANPALENGFLYASDSAGNVVKINEASGVTVWMQNLHDLLGLPPVSPVGIDMGFSRNTPIITEDSVVLGIRYPGWMVSLDKMTGALKWTSIVDAHPAASITSSGTYEDGVVYIGVSSFEEAFAVSPLYPCCSFVGTMNALNATTGELIWTTPMIPDQYVGVGQYAGCALWSSAPAIDGDNVYVTSGNLYSFPDAVGACVEACEADPESCVNQPPCVPEDILYNAIVAINKKTGEISWSHRLDTVDAWNGSCTYGDGSNCPIPAGPDFDFGQCPIIFGDDGLIVGQKSGVIYSINRLNGTLKWSFVTGPGGPAGGVQWGSTMSKTKTGRDIFIAQNGNSLGLNFTLANGETWNQSVVVALDAQSGELVWQTPVVGSTQGALTSNNKVVFSPNYSTGAMNAYSVEDGSLVWSYTTNSSMMCGATINTDRIYFGNGYLSLFGGRPGRVLFAFELE